MKNVRITILTILGTDHLVIRRKAFPQCPITYPNPITEEAPLWTNG